MYRPLTAEDVVAVRDEFGPAFAELLADVRRVRSRRSWAAIMLAPRLEVCESILLGRRVRVDTLDPVALRRALRGATPTPGSDYIAIAAEELDAVDEAGPFVVVQERRR
jgi:hypothetical protein